MDSSLHFLPTRSFYGITIWHLTAEKSASHPPTRPLGYSNHNVFWAPFFFCPLLLLFSSIRSRRWLEARVLQFCWCLPRLITNSSYNWTRRQCCCHPFSKHHQNPLHLSLCLTFYSRRIDDANEYDIYVCGVRVRALHTAAISVIYIYYIYLPPDHNIPDICTT